MSANKYGYSEPYYSTTATQPIPVNVVATAQQRPWFDPWYLATIPGGVKMLQVVGGGGATVAILLINGAFYGTYVACGVSIACFSCSLVLLIMHLYNLIPLVTFIDMRFWEFVYVALWTALNALAAGIMIYSSVMWRNYRVQWGAAGACCVLSCVACFVDCIDQVRQRRLARNGQSAPGRQPPIRTTLA